MQHSLLQELLTDCKWLKLKRLSSKFAASMCELLLDSSNTSQESFEAKLTSGSWQIHLEQTISDGKILEDMADKTSLPDLLTLT